MTDKPLEEKMKTAKTVKCMLACEESWRKAAQVTAECFLFKKDWESCVGVFLHECQVYRE